MSFIEKCSPEACFAELKTLAVKHKQLLLELTQYSYDSLEYRHISKELANTQAAYELYNRLSKLEEDLAYCESLPEEEKKTLLLDLELYAERQRLYEEALMLLAPKESSKRRAIIDKLFLELRAGTGGKEATLFAMSLLEMYTRYAEAKRWECTIDQLVNSDGVDGISSAVLHLKGVGAQEYLQYETGVHRVQRVPDTETQGRVHTSTAVVTILPEEEQQFTTINPQDLRIDTFRSSGPGGQHVNKTDSAVRIVHLPTGLKVECQSGRSQHQNKEQALAQLQAKLAQQQEAENAQRKSEIRTQYVGDRSEKIRTYNYNQHRITDHRVPITTYKFEEVLNGNLEIIILPLKDHFSQVQ